MIKKYIMLQPHFGNESGTEVYKTRKHDFGLARDDTNNTGQEHISVTLNKDGDYPFFTIPVHKLKEVPQCSDS